MATVDVITPIVDDPETFGRIAAANSISDVYAMGGRPMLSLSVACFNEKLPTDAMGEILAGAAAVALEAGAPILGGHTIKDNEVKFGLAVIGEVHPDHILRSASAHHGALLIADEVQTGIGRCGRFFAVQVQGITPDILTSAKALGGGIPCGAVLCTKDIADCFGPGDLGTTFGGGPVAVAAISAVISAIESEGLLANVREREAQIREQCGVGPVRRIQGMGLLLGLVCDKPAIEVRNALLENDILTGTSADPNVLRILAPLVITAEHVDRLAEALGSISRGGAQ